MSTFYEITESEMDELLEPKGFEEVVIRGTKEKVYDFEHPKHPGFGIRVYSSIKDGTARGCGKDAIRCVYWSFEYDKPMGKTRRVNRIETWKKNLLKRLRLMAGTICEFKKHECPQCGAPLVRRKSKYGPFYGCLTYPKCKKTVDAEKIDKAIERRQEQIK